MHAFRCKNCGRLHESGQAGTAAHPHACQVCNAGVEFHPQSGTRTVAPDNWEVLADATPERLEELGLSPDDIERHVPQSRERSIQEDAYRCNQALEQLRQKRERWEAEKGDRARRWRQADDMQAELEPRLDDARLGGDPSLVSSLADQLAGVRQEMSDLEASVPTTRDDQLEAELRHGLQKNEARLAGIGGGESPRHILASASEGHAAGNDAEARK